MKLYISAIFPVILIVLLLSIRLPYIFSFPSPLFTSDTSSYHELSKVLQKSFWPSVINDHRTPVYPMFMILSRNMLPQLGNWSIIYLQTLISIAILLCVYHFLCSLRIKSHTAFFLTLFLGCNPQLFAWDRAVLTESLAISWLLVMTIVSILFIKKPTTHKSVLMGILAIIGFLLRPIFVLLPCVLWIIVLFSNKQTYKSIIVLLVLYLFVVLAYVQLNGRFHNYFGINHLADINLMGIILKENLSVEAGKNYPFFYDAVKKWRAENGTSMPYRFLEHYDPQIYLNQNRLNQLQQFTRLVILDNFPTYIWKSIAEIPHAIFPSQPYTVIEIPTTSQGPNNFYAVLLSFYQVTLFVPLILLWTFPVLALTKITQKRSYPDIAILLCGGISWYMILMGVLFDYDEYARVVGIAQPFFYAYSFGLLSKVHLSNHEYHKK